MKRILLSNIVAVIFIVFPLIDIQAAENVLIGNSISDPSFDVKVLDVNKVTDTDFTVFSFETRDIANPSLIGFWKIRVYCDKGVSIAINGFTGNNCGKAVFMENTKKNEKFFLSFLNTKPKSTNFSFKLKSYDKNGEWLHSEKESFRWK